MKVKRFNNLWTMGLILCAVILVVIYVGKIFFPTFVIEIAQSETICKIGHYIDSNKWAWYLVNSIIAFSVYYILCCTVCRKFRLSLKEISYIIITMIVVELSKEFLPMQYNILNFSSLIFLPYLVKGSFTATTVWFVSTNLIQSFTLEIRNLVYYISDFNSATALILMIDVYIFELLLCFAFNFKKGGNE